MPQGTVAQLLREKRAMYRQNPAETDALFMPTLGKIDPQIPVALRAPVVNGAVMFGIPSDEAERHRQSLLVTMQHVSGRFIFGVALDGYEEFQLQTVEQRDRTVPVFALQRPVSELSLTSLDGRSWHAPEGTIACRISTRVIVERLALVAFTKQNTSRRAQ